MLAVISRGLINGPSPSNGSQDCSSAWWQASWLGDSSSLAGICCSDDGVFGVLVVSCHATTRLTSKPENRTDTDGKGNPRADSQSDT
jgi:hypothetical protein